MARLKVLLLILIVLPFLVWGAFRLWLVNQDPSLRASIEAFSTLEFLAVVSDAIAPGPRTDRAGYGRRDYAGRGRSPWVLRSSLDGRPRMLTLAVSPDRWVSYDTQTASLYQFWEGALHLTGPVYDGRHGFEPSSEGRAFLRMSDATAWRVFEEGEWRPARTRWRAHGFDSTSGALWFRIEVRGTLDETPRTVTIWPELVLDGDRVGLEESFTTMLGPGPALALQLSKSADQIETNGVFEADAGRLPIRMDVTRLVQWFDAPGIEIAAAAAPHRDRDAFGAYDCHTCHNEQERIVGPAWSEVALRYAGIHPETAARNLAARIIQGSEGRWGSVPMTPHPDLGRDEAETLARIILATEPAEAPAVRLEDAGADATWSYGWETEDRPETLHPSLSSFPIDTETFTPRVGGLAWLPDGRLAVATWDRDGSVFAVEGWDGASGPPRIERIAEGLQEPLGLAVVGDDLYVMQKQEITRLVDRDGDGWVDEYAVVNADWEVTSNFHEFGFGLVELDGALHGGLSVCVLVGGKSCREQTPDRGKVFRVSLETGELEFLASGFRTPNGLASTPDGRLLVTDNQGDWLPASKLVEVRKGEFHGWRAPGDERDHGPAIPPVLWLPQNEVGNSPTQPLVLSQGRYAGHVFFGDVFNGGIKRAFLEEVDGRLQGAAFHFTGGLRGPVNRLLETPAGDLVVGEVGSGGNWGEFGKQWFGLEWLRFGDAPAFEPLRVLVRSDGFEIHFSQPIAHDFDLGPDHFELRDWFYVPSPIYGGPKYDVRDLVVEDVSVSADRRVVSLRVAGLAIGRVVYLHLDDALRSESGDPLWVNEAWYTLNALPGRAASREASVEVLEGPAMNTLSREERDAGWRLLFDGKGFDGWKIYGAEDGSTEGWVVEDGALAFTRDVSLAGLVWNHINPFSTAALDLMTEERFGDFELSIDWKISEGGNSGIFYLVPDESASLSWTYGVEMQVLDDERHGDGKLDRRRAGDLYDLVASRIRPVRPAGEWNRARILVRGSHLEHWLNGEKLLEIERGSADWDRRVAESKFDGIEGMGRASRGHLTLQDHGDRVWYRNIKIREID